MAQVRRIVRLDGQRDCNQVGVSFGLGDSFRLGDHEQRAGGLVRGDSVTPGVVSGRCGNNGKIWRS